MIHAMRIRGRGHMRKLLRSGVIALAALATPALAQEANFVEKHGDWSVYTHNSSDKKVCFVVAQPRTKKPSDVKRGPVYFYVSDWANDEVDDEVSIKLGYPLKEGVPVEVKIASATYNLFTKDEGAYVERKQDEKDLVDAMRAGLTMIVQGRSARGTLTTDEYSLNGVTKALEVADQQCS